MPVAAVLNQHEHRETVAGIKENLDNLHLKLI